MSAKGVAKNNGKDDEKRPPGRPRKKPRKVPMKRNGVVTVPKKDTSQMEMVYDTPMILKRLFGFYKSMAIKDLAMEFTDKSVIFYAIDHVGKSHCKTIIDCTKVNHYYCKEPSKIYLTPKEMEDVVQILDKEYLSIAFVLKTTTSRSVFTIIYKHELKIDEHREISHKQASTTVFRDEFDTTGYPIKFTLPSGYFKKLVNNINKFSNVLTIGKVGDRPLTFAYPAKAKTVKSTYVVQDGKRINLQSTVSDEDIFTSTVTIEYIRPISRSMLTDVIDIAVDTHRKMVFKLVIDSGAVTILINTLTVKPK
jgi:hypothetical protein